MQMTKAYLRGGGVRGFKIEGKEVEGKIIKKGQGGGGLIVNIFLGSEIFWSGVQIFLGGGEKFSGG